ncbi:helix-turn-helix domain-containing protein [Streptomyces sp. Isolate_219]|uniref:AraC-like ligand-binding domain-containing protein n=1 Tax=Streptomyces sp. Isolate_219 TaxID=2950110 RepID=UPI0021C85568|nr:helix-turn-helix domain-containing protein [Streptomyces sp. Isolate_219]MCR8576334.1 helix-turn-helix domain-containing protein [Streptomyces sp. Isolate_219]
MSDVWSTNALPAGEQLAFWHDLVCDTFVPLDVATPGTGPFTGSLTTHQVGTLRIATVDADPHCVTRRPRLITSGEEFTHIGLLCKGQAVVEQDGRQASLHPGDLAFYDTTRPFLLGFREPMEWKVFMLPRRLLSIPEADLRRMSAETVRGGEGLGRLIVPFLAGLAEQTGPYGEESSTRLAASAVGLLETLVAERSGRQGLTAEADPLSLSPRIRSYINERLPDPGLSSESIARAHHISVRYLQKLFQQEGTTVHRWIQQRRLEEARRELSRQGRATVTIAFVAHRWGFADPAHFSRSFRAAYDMTPREWRKFGRTGE